MSTQDPHNPAPQEPVQHDRAFNEMMKLFNEKSFFEKWKSTFIGLGCPKNSGEYKMAKLQIQLMTGPILAILLPFIAIALLLSMQPPAADTSAIIGTDIDILAALPEIEEPPPPPPPDPTEFKPLDTEFDAPTTTFNPEISTVSADVPLSPKPAVANTVALNRSPITMPGMVGSRSPGHQGAALKRFGGSPGGEATVMRSLRWLKSKQLPNGSWPGQATANTSLALLCFLAHGEVPNRTTNPEFAETVEKGLQFLTEQQENNGLFKSQDGNNYAHLIATYALAEAYSLTKVPMLKTAVEKAAVPIIKGQHPTGGWTYKLHPGVEENGRYRDDTSYMGWAAQALKAVKMAKDTAGLTIEGLDEACKLAIKGFKVNADPNGGFGYDSRGQGGLSGVGVLCMQLLGAAKESEVRKTLEYLRDCKFSFSKWDDKTQPKGWGHSPIYYWYYITQAKFHSGGSDWEKWNKEFAPELIKNQQILQADSDTDRIVTQYGNVIPEKSTYQDHTGKYRDIGYWDSPAHNEYDGMVGGDRHNNANRWLDGKQITEADRILNNEGNPIKVNATTDGQRIQVTALCALQMMVYYRYLPTFETPQTEDAPKETAPSVDDDIPIFIR